MIQLASALHQQLDSQAWDEHTRDTKYGMRFSGAGQNLSRSEQGVQSRVSPWTLLSHLEITLFLISAALSAAAVTFLDVTLAPFLKDHVGYSEGVIGDYFAFIAAAYAIGTIMGG